MLMEKSYFLHILMLEDCYIRPSKMASIFALCCLFLQSSLRSMSSKSCWIQTQILTHLIVLNIASESRFRDICNPLHTYSRKLNFISAACMQSRFSRVRLCATPQTASYQAPLSLGFSRQEHWSGQSQINHRSIKNK